MIDDLYSAKVLTLAANLPRVGRLAAPDGTVVFLEVKTRRSNEYGGAESVTAKKLLAMRRCAGEWLDRSPHGGYVDVRFDVCEVVFDGAGFTEYTMLRFEGVEDGAC